MRKEERGIAVSSLSFAVYRIRRPYFLLSVSYFLLVLFLLFPLHCAKKYDIINILMFQ